MEKFLQMNSHIKDKVVVIIADNTAKMDAAVKKMSVRRIGCFAHTLNIAAQKNCTLYPQSGLEESEQWWSG